MPLFDAPQWLLRIAFNQKVPDETSASLEGVLSKVCLT